MPEADNEGKKYYEDIPQEGKLFFLKGSNELDWGMKNRLARIFNPNDGHTVMLAIDHGYFQGPTSGLERIDVSIMPLVPDADVLMCTRGILRTIVPPVLTKPIVIRASGGPSILKELSDEHLAMDMEDCIRLGVCATAIQGIHRRPIRNPLCYEYDQTGECGFALWNSYYGQLRR